MGMGHSKHYENLPNANIISTPSSYGRVFVHNITCRNNRTLVLTLTQCVDFGREHSRFSD